MGKSSLLIGASSINGSCSIAMLNNQRVADSNKINDNDNSVYNDDNNLIFPDSWKSKFYLVFDECQS